MIRLFAPVLLSLAVAGCASPSLPTSHLVTGKARAAISPSDVVVYRSLPENYDEVAMLSATSSVSLTFGDPSQTEEVVSLLKSEAAALGANGVVLTYLNDNTVIVNVNTLHGFQASASKEGRFQKVAQAYALFVE